MNLQIFGTGCAKCLMLGEHAQAAAQALGLPYEFEKVTDMNAIIDAGITRTPALGVDGEIKSAGKGLAVEEIKKLLSV